MNHKAFRTFAALITADGPTDLVAAVRLGVARAARTVASAHSVLPPAEIP